DAAPTDGMTTFDQRLIHRDRATEPRVPPITDLSRLSTVGVALSTCTTSIARMQGVRGARRHRARTRTTLGRVSGLIGGRRTVVGCITRRGRVTQAIGIALTTPIDEFATHRSVVRVPT